MHKHIWCSLKAVFGEEFRDVISVIKQSKSDAGKKNLLCYCKHHLL